LERLINETKTPVDIRYRPQDKTFEITHDDNVSFAHRILDRAAYIDYQVFLGDHSDMPSAWKVMQYSAYEDLPDHSSHNLYPFEGKLRPKVARALINICLGPQKEGTVLDPFCGSGTVLLEAALMNYGAVGCDVDPFAVWLTNTKTTADPDIFKQEAPKVKPNRKIFQSYAHFTPKRSAAVVLADAITYVRSCKNVAAVVTSPPYFNAIDYNDRHVSVRRQLSLHPPTQHGLGTRQSVAGYEADVRSVSDAIAKALAPGGLAAIVVGDHENVPSSEWYELYLKAAGLVMVRRLRRPYREVTRGFHHDEIIIMGKPNGRRKSKKP
jgi:tRNA G10  N-methylase Trm11